MTRRAYGTQREIRAFFESRGIRPKKSLGQNFLVDRNLLRVIVDAAQVGPDDVVLEIGAGTGALTELLAERCRQVIAVEIDDVLYGILCDTLSGVGNLRLVGGSILGKDDAVAPAVQRALDETPTAGDATLHVVGDLPYSVATPTLQALFDLSPVPRSLTVVVQAEVAERIASGPGSKQYGYMSVLVQSRAKAEVLRTLPPSVFWPRPRVQSALLRIEVDADRMAALPAIDTLKRTASALFTHRRKTAANSLGNSDVVADKAEAAALLEEAGIDPAARADAIAVADIVALARLVEAKEA